MVPFAPAIYRASGHLLLVNNQAAFNQRGKKKGEVSHWIDRINGVLEKTYGWLEADSARKLGDLGIVICGVPILEMEQLQQAIGELHVEMGEVSDGAYRLRKHALQSLYERLETAKVRAEGLVDSPMFPILGLDEFMRSVPRHNDRIRLLSGDLRRALTNILLTVGKYKSFDRILSLAILQDQAVLAMFLTAVRDLHDVAGIDRALKNIADEGNVAEIICLASLVRRRQASEDPVVEVSKRVNGGEVDGGTKSGKAIEVKYKREKGHLFIPARGGIQIASKVKAKFERQARAYREKIAAGLIAAVEYHIIMPDQVGEDVLEILRAALGSDYMPVVYHYQSLEDCAAGICEEIK